MIWILCSVCASAFSAAWTLGRRALAAALLLVSSLGFAFATLSVSRLVTARYGGEGCTPSCDVVGGGWPIAWAVDNPGLSPVGVVTAPGVLLGEDEVRGLALLAVVAVFALLQAAAAVVLGFALRQRPARPLP